QPGLALSWLARGRITAASTAINRLLADAGGPVQRARLLPAAVDVLVSARQVDQARQHSDELSGIAAAFENTARRAMATYAVAKVDLLSGEPDAALRTARESRRLWNALGSPYEAARARILVARAMRELGDEDSANAELAVARNAFVALDVSPGVQEIDKLQGRVRPAGLTEREL